MLWNCLLAIYLSKIVFFLGMEQGQWQEERLSCSLSVPPQVFQLAREAPDKKNCFTSWEEREPLTHCRSFKRLLLEITFRYKLYLPHSPLPTGPLLCWSYRPLRTMSHAPAMKWSLVTKFCYSKKIKLRSFSLNTEPGSYNRVFIATTENFFWKPGALFDKRLFAQNNYTVTDWVGVDHHPIILSIASVLLSYLWVHLNDFFSRTIHEAYLNSGVRLLLELYCDIVIKYVAFFTICAKLAMAFAFTSLPLNFYTSVTGCGCGFGFEQKYWRIDGLEKK